jgi:hypothetical protein
LHRTAGNSAVNSVEQAQVHNLHVKRSTVYFQILPVTVFGKNGRCIDTCALLDSASDVTLIDDQLCKDLGLKGVSKKLKVNTMGSSLSMPSMCVSLSIKSKEEPGALPLWIQEAWTKHGGFNCPTVRNSDVSDLQHLQGLNLQDINPKDVKMLIGANVPRAHFQLELRHGQEHEPVAIHTPLGWCIMGGSSHDVDATVNLMMSEDADLHKSIEQFWSTESFGVTVNLKHPASLEDQRALEILNTNTRLVGHHYEVPMLLWKSSDMDLQNNRSMAESRFNTLNEEVCEGC